MVCSEDNPVVETRAGKVRGSTVQSILGKVYYAFKGIPYARPPVGELRFQVSLQISFMNVFLKSNTTIQSYVIYIGSILSSIIVQIL